MATTIEQTRQAIVKLLDFGFDIFHLDAFKVAAVAAVQPSVLTDDALAGMLMHFTRSAPIAVSCGSDATHVARVCTGADIVKMRDDFIAQLNLVTDERAEKLALFYTYFMTAANEVQSNLFILSNTAS